MDLALTACGSGQCIDSSTAVVLFALVVGAFGMGYAVGQSVLWVRRLSEVA